MSDEVTTNAAPAVEPVEAPVQETAPAQEAPAPEVSQPAA
jgi:hypothetical protein